MREYEIVFAPTAIEDLDEILSWLTEQAPEKTGEWLGSLKAEVETLRTMPERCPLAPESGLWGEDELRQFLFQSYPSKYRVIYTITKGSVRILNVRHGARRYLHEE